MKKQLFTLLTLLVCVCTGAWADATETIFVNSSKNWEGASLFSVSVEGSSMQPGYCKWTKGNSMTISNTNSKTITGITITYTEQGYSPSNSNKTYSDQMSVTTGTLTAKATTTTTTWSGSTSTASFVIGWSSGGWDLRVTSVAITYDDGKTTSSFALTSEPEVEVAIDGTSQITYSNNAGTVTYTSANEDVAEVSESGLITAKAGGKTTISVIDAGSASISGATKTVTVLVPYPNPTIVDSYVLNQDTYSFSNNANTKYFFTNGFTISLSSGASFDNGALNKSKKYSHARTYTIHTPSNVNATFAVITARNNYKNENNNPAANWGNVFGTDYSSEGNLPWSNEDPAEKDFIIASPSPGADLVFQPGDNQWQAIIELYTVTYGAKYTVSYASADGTGSMSDETHRAYASFTLPASTFTPPTDKAFDGWLCSVDGITYAAGASYTMTDVNTTFTAQYASAEGKTLIRVTLNGGKSATVTGAIGGTADVNVQSDKKFGSGHYAGFTLAGTNTFKTGDIINVNIAANASGSGSIAVYDTDKSTVLYNTETKGDVGDNTFTLPAACNGKSTLYICRTSDNGWNAVVNYIEVSRPVSVTIANSGYSSLGSAYGLDFANATTSTENAAKLTAFAATESSETSVKLVSIDEAPAETGVILKGTAGATYTIPVKADAAALTVTNLLHAAVTATPILANTSYIMQGGKFHLVTEASDVPAGKAYLVPGTSQARELTFFFDGETTGINVATEKKNTATGVYYNLAGQRVNQPAKGIYIVDGKKVIK